jgi:hypothetical protein
MGEVDDKQCDGRGPSSSGLRGWPDQPSDDRRQHRVASCDDQDATEERQPFDRSPARCLSSARRPEPWPAQSRRPPAGRRRTHLQNPGKHARRRTTRPPERRLGARPRPSCRANPRCYDPGLARRSATSQPFMQARVIGADRTLVRAAVRQAEGVGAAMPTGSSAGAALASGSCGGRPSEFVLRHCGGWPAPSALPGSL